MRDTLEEIMSMTRRHRKGVFWIGLGINLVVVCGCIGMRTALDDDLQSNVCGVSTSMRTVHPVPDVLIVLDRSSSMNSSLSSDSSCGAGATNCTTRLAAVISALETVVADNPNIHWGLELFSTPNTSTCTVSSAPQVAVAANTASAINRQLATLTTERSSPTAAALEVATAYLKKLSDGNSKAILLATDGLPGCAGSSLGDDDLAGAVSAATEAKKAGFPVYVIGIGPNVSNLNSLAIAGGTRSYFPVTSTGALDDALGSIVKVVSLCTFKADKAPANKDLVYVNVGQQQVAQDPDNGWIFDSSDPTFSTISLTGQACQDMLNGTTSTVEIVQHDCPDSPK
jgi:hypothetical protein